MNTETSELLLNAHSYLERLIIGLDNKQKLFLKRDMSSLSDLPDVIDGINWLLTTMTGTKDIHGIAVNALEIKGVLNDLVDAVANEDFTLLTDIVEYEIRPVLCEFYDALDEILFPASEEEV